MVIVYKSTLDNTLSRHLGFCAGRVLDVGDVHLLLVSSQPRHVDPQAAGHHALVLLGPLGRGWGTGHRLVRARPHARRAVALLPLLEPPALLRAGLRGVWLVPELEPAVARLVSVPRLWARATPPGPPPGIIILLPQPKIFIVSFITWWTLLRP